jgi:hypothetical protein
MGRARIPRSSPSISASPFVRAGRPGRPLRRRRSAVTTSWGDVCSAPGRHPHPPPWWGWAVLAPLHKRAAPPPGFYPARGPCLASRTLRPRWRRSSSLRSASMWRRRRGSIRHAARAPTASLLGPRGPGSDPRSPSPRPRWRQSSPLRSASTCSRRWSSTRPGRAARASPLRFSGPVGRARIPRSFPSISALPFVRAGRPGPPLRRRRSAVTTSGGGVCLSPGRHPHPRWGGRLRSAPQARGAAARVLPCARPALPPGFYPVRGPPAVEAAPPPPSTFLCRCCSAPPRVVVD